MPEMNDAPREVANANYTGNANVANGKRTHPLVIVAAGAVTLFSVVGIGVLTGLIPNALSGGAQKSESVSTAVSPMTPGMAIAPAGSVSDVVTAEQLRKSEAVATTSAATQLPPITSETLGQPNAKYEAKTDARQALTKPATPVVNQVANSTVPTPVYSQGAQGTTARTSVPTPAYNPATSPTMAPDSVAQATPPTKAVSPVTTICRQCGVVDGIYPVEKKVEGSGAGAVIGGLIGGVLGHQAGSGRGKDVATVAGAVGGALIGNQVEKNNAKSQSFDVRVRMEDGTFRTARLETAADFRVGDKVRFEESRLLRR